MVLSQSRRANTAAVALPSRSRAEAASIRNCSRLGHRGVILVVGPNREVRSQRPLSRGGIRIHRIAQSS